MLSFKDFHQPEDMIHEGCSYIACACCDYFVGCSIYKAAKAKFEWKVSDRGWACAMYTNNEKYKNKRFVVKHSEE